MSSRPIVSTASSISRGASPWNGARGQVSVDQRRALAAEAATPRRPSEAGAWALTLERGAHAVRAGVVAPGRGDAARYARPVAGGPPALAYFAARTGPVGAAKLPGADLLCPGEIKALTALQAARPKEPAQLFLLTDPNKDPDDLSVMIHLKHLSDGGFVELRGVVTTLGDEATRAKRAEFAATVLEKVGLEAPVGVGGDYDLEVRSADGSVDAQRTEGRKKDHAKYVENTLVVPGAHAAAIAKDGRSMLREGLRKVADDSAVLLVNAGMADAAALLRDDPTLAKKKVSRLVVMGGVGPTLDAQGHVTADGRAYNNTTDQASADFVYKKAQELGIELVVVAKEAAYAAAAPRSFYDGAAKTGHEVGIYLKDQQATALEHLWDGINAGHMPPALTPAWFFKTFTDVNPDTPAGAATIDAAVANKGDFDAVWGHVTKFNLYDPLALLAAAPGASELLFAGGEVAAATSKARVLGAAEVKDCALAKDLMSGMAVVSLASSMPARKGA